MNEKSRRRISFSDLGKILQEVNEKSYIEKTSTKSSWDFTLAIPFLKENGLDENICFRSFDKGLPLNSERKIYTRLANILIRNLTIKSDDALNWGKQSDWKPAFDAKWHFEECRIEPWTLAQGSIYLPWSGDFRFYKNEFSFDDGKGTQTWWSFVFGRGSDVLFQKSNFENSIIQIRCKGSENGSDSRHLELGKLSFLGNKGIDSLQLMCNADSYVFRGTNHINSLSFSGQNSNSLDLDSKIYIGPRERIDPYFHYPFHHRNLFLSLREYAGKKQDAYLVNVLDKQLDRVEYFLTKDQEISFVADKREWFEYWQDRILYAWRRWSSDFYRSWLRPLLMIILGYLALNACPLFWIESFTFSDWIAFSLRPISQIHLYAGSLEAVCGDEYKCLPLRSKNWLSFIGLLQMIWIAVWGFAFSKSIKR